MGHQNTCENLRPRDEWVGCSEHDEYNDNCFGCWIRNGGGDD